MNAYTAKAIAAAILRFSGDTGLKFSLDSIRSNSGLSVNQKLFRIEGLHLSPKATGAAQLSRMPIITFAVSKLTNKAKEKLAAFNAAATVVCGLQLSHEKQIELQQETYEYVDSIVDVLHRSRGLWAQGVFYGGGFEASIAPISSGSLNYNQFATIEFEVTLWEV